MENSKVANILNRWSGRPYSVEILEKRKKLAIWQHRDQFLNAFRANQVLALVAQTGSGKSTQVISLYFLALHIMKVPGRLHPVEIVYTSDEEVDRNNYLDAVTKTVVNIHRHEPPGDVLVFLSEEGEVEDACNKISKEICNLKNLVGPMKLVPLYSCLPATMQHKIFEPCSGRKIVVTTNIVESSLSMDGISYVVDSGFVKKNVFDNKLRMESLVTSTISKASANMRSEHASRSTSDGRRGKCFRLYTEESFNNNFDLETCPEIWRLNLSNMILSFWKPDVYDFLCFGYVDFPDVENLVCAFEELAYLGAFDRDCKITNIGEVMSVFPLEPRMSKMLVISPEFNCSQEILSISSMLSVPNCFVGSREEQKEVKVKFHSIHGDHLTFLNIYRAYKQNNEDLSWCNDNFISYWTLKEADNIRQELEYIMMARFKLDLCRIDINNTVNIRKSILGGYFMHVAHLDTTGNYITLEGNKVVTFHQLSNCLDDNKPEWVIFNEFPATGCDFIHIVTTIPKDWLIDSAAPWSLYYKLSNYPNSEAKSTIVYASYARMLKERKLTDGKLGKHANISTFHRLLPYHNNRKRKERL
ncbi:probable pre-mRNA-splicing factor ATP-dependent RNA helicase DEAH3 [Lathyrus oleraceus]|uniref:RNA helicase n=1 Tax=Pisum sativum TaxID=3888 RepID=A0A9D4WIC2_PEA|nr:probable pre-mRNA-splicing factor ATP-dependent RNA helicase DEAH3 [Pisum sativum]KAI5402077.1 hypothetical protein KIW84_066521 [Pisum sativum]